MASKAEKMPFFFFSSMKFYCNPFNLCGVYNLYVAATPFLMWRRKDIFDSKGGCWVCIFSSSEGDPRCPPFDDDDIELGRCQKSFKLLVELEQQHPGKQVLAVARGGPVLLMFKKPFERVLEMIGWIYLPFF